MNAALVIATLLGGVAAIVTLVGVLTGRPTEKILRSRPQIRQEEPDDHHGAPSDFEPWFCALGLLAVIGGNIMLGIMVWDPWVGHFKTFFGGLFAHLTPIAVLFGSMYLWGGFCYLLFPDLFDNAAEDKDAPPPAGVEEESHLHE